MLAAAVADAWSTYLYWLPCRGSMLDGTIIHPTVGDGPSYEDFEKLDPAVKARMFACERRMDGDISEQWPWTSELGVAVMAPAGVAWLTLVLGQRWQLRTEAVASLPGLAGGRSCQAAVWAFVAVIVAIRRRKSAQGWMRTGVIYESTDLAVALAVLDNNGGRATTSVPYRVCLTGFSDLFPSCGKRRGSSRTRHGLMCSLG